MSLTTAQFIVFMERLARTWADNDTPMSLAHFTEDAVYIEPPDLQGYQGHNQLRLFFNDLTPGTKMEWHNLWFNENAQCGAGEYSFSLGEWTNQANHGVAVVELRDGKIAVWREYQRKGPVEFEDFLGLSAGQKPGTAGSSQPLSNEQSQRGLLKLRNFLQKIPAISELETSEAGDNEWWVKFSIDIKSPIAWHVVQELGHLLNYIAVSERLPTLFMPVSPPPYLNGGPDEYLSWVIESRGPNIDAGEITRVLEGRLPNPVDEIEAWLDNEDEDDED